MTTVAEISGAVRRLPKRELAKFRKWFAEFDAAAWDREFERMSRALAVITMLGSVAVLLSSIGLAGLAGYTVAQRTREIGLRMALGAQQSNVLRLIVGEGMMVGLAGIGAGLIGAYGLSRALATLPEPDHRALAAAIPALQRLAERMESP